MALAFKKEDGALSLSHPQYPTMCLSDMVAACFSAKFLRIFAGSCFSNSLLSQEQLMTNTAFCFKYRVMSSDVA